MKNTRAELHLHTKMGNMNAVGDIEEYIKLAKDNNLSAIAVTDYNVVRAFPRAYKLFRKYGVKLIYGAEIYKETDTDKKCGATVLAKNKYGLKTLYEIITALCTKTSDNQFDSVEKIILDDRKNLLVGACDELRQAIIDGKAGKELRDIIDFYDFLEVQPYNDNDINEQIVALGEKYNKPVVAASDAHYVYAEDKIGESVLLHGIGEPGFDNIPPLHIRTTDEMMKEFAYLGEDMAKKVVIENSNLIADMCDDTFSPFPTEKKKFEIKGARETLVKQVKAKLEKLYGKNPDEIIEKRFHDELEIITKNNYESLFVLVAEIVNHIADKGYLVGNRGCIGSSFIAYLLGITETNPLKAHYVCPACQRTEFSDINACGADMPDKNCPDCQTKMKKDGFNLPYEILFGLDGEKEPDIDLNIPTSMSNERYKHLQDLLGKDRICCAGAIGVLTDIRAQHYIREFQVHLGKRLLREERKTAQNLLCNVARAVGRQPGGILIAPEGAKITDYTPLQDVSGDLLGSHFDNHDLRGELLKVGVLTHDDPEILKVFGETTGANPLDIPLNDEKTMNLFQTLDTAGVDGFETEYVKDMLKIIKPRSFEDLIRILGLSHGTGTWTGNADKLLTNGIAKSDEVISCRDDVFVTLMQHGVHREKAYEISEQVRKGRGLSESDIDLMTKSNVPDWFIKSCQKIMYLFPRAHAVSYALMEYRIAYYKSHYPMEFSEGMHPICR